MNDMNDKSSEDKKIVLAIDDAAINLATIKAILSNDMDVRVAKSAEVALFILGSVKVDLILLDIEMPGMSGFDFLEVLREIPDVSRTPVIFVTSHANAGFVARASKRGVKEYIVKPINALILKSKVYGVLEMELPDALKAQLEMDARKPT